MFCRLAVLLPLLLVAPVAAQDSVLVLDASNSMWGRVDGRPKIAVAREAVGALARALPAGARMGLMAYGHRRAGDCRDIEVLLPVAPVDAAVFARLAGALTPRGRTPIAEAVTQAAALAPRVVLVSDGIETCVPDACAAVRALRAQLPALVVDVIGFDVADVRDQAQLACLAEATGGRFLTARSAADLGRALGELTTTAPPPAPPAPPRAAVVTETNLTLEAVEVEGGPVVPVGAWTLIELDRDPPAPVFANNGAARPAARVRPGRYEVQMRAGTARVTERFVADGVQMVQRVVLNLGTLEGIGSLSAGGPPFGGNWTVVADEVPGARAGETVTTSAARPATFRLVQGSYRIRFEAGLARTEADVFVPAGGRESLRVALDAAEVTLVATRGGSPVAIGLTEVRRTGATRTEGSSGAGRPRFVLPAGAWIARLRVDGTWHEVPLTVASGEQREVMIPLL